MALLAPVAEIYIYPQLVNPMDPAETYNNLSRHKPLFAAAIFCYLLTFLGDIIVAWALYILLKPVNEPLSQIAALFRLVFSVLSIAALFNLVTVCLVLTTNDYIALFGRAQTFSQVMLLLKSFRTSYHYSIIFFSFHLLLVGCLAFISGYIPKWLGIVLIISGLGYLTDTLKPFLFPDFHSVFLTVTFFGELVFMFWLLFKGVGR